MNASTGISSTHRYVNRSAYVQPVGVKSLPNQWYPAPGAISWTVAIATSAISTTVSVR
jgi:hypothetical protein